MTSREEFMRQMGITTDDLNKPEEYVPPPRKERPSVIPSSATSTPSGATTNSTTLRAKNSNTASASSTAAQQDYYEMKQQRQQQQQEPSASSSYSTSLQQKKASAPAPASQQSASSRAEFLRSLGIDNATDDLPSNLRGTNDDAQQSEREQRQQAAYTSASVRSALRRSEVNGEEEAHNSPSTTNYGPRGGNTTNTTTATSGLNTSSHVTSGAGIGLDSSYTSTRAYNAGAGFTSSAPAPAPSSASAMRRNSSSAQSLNSSMNGSSSFTSSAPLLDIHGVEVPIDASADDLKKHGNKFYEAGDFRKAVRFYSRSIDKDPNNQVLFSNRSAAYLLASKQMALDTRTMALRDADKCIELKPDWFKGYSRRGDALFKLERFEEACDSYRAALERDPANEAILSSLEQCKMCCGPKKDNSFAWSQPRDYHPTGRGASASLNSTSRSSMGGTSHGGGLDTSKSAHELLDEFRQASTRATGASVSAADYRERELARFRDQRRGGSTASSASRSNPGDNNAMNTTTASSNGDASFTSTGGNDLNNSSSAGSKKLPDLMNSAYSSEAAANYQANLLEAYRRKKAGKQ